MALSDSKLKIFADFIEKELGIVYVKDSYYQLEQRLDKVAGMLSLKTAEEVYQKAVLEGISGHLKAILLDIATNNETLFFRDPRVYQAIEKQILPSFKVDHPRNFIYRIWSCAASFGQEPYSLAMLSHEFLASHTDHPRIQIMSSDISEQALKRCNEAKYSQLEVQRGLSAQRLIKYFTKNEENYWELKPEIKSLVEFRKQNLLEPFTGLGAFNLIFCRYVLIYQDQERKKQIIEKLIKCLSPKGCLFLGASESALGISTDLVQREFEGAIYYQKKE